MHTAQATYQVSGKMSWDKHVAASPWGHFLQSWAWGEFREKNGWRVQRYSVDGASAQVLWRPTPFGYSGYVPRGPAADLSSPYCADLWEAIHASARRMRALFLRVEPNAASGEALLAQGFRRVHPCLQPEATLVVNLEPDLTSVRARMRPKTRYNIGLAQRRGVAVRSAEAHELPAFYALLQETAKRDRFYVRPLSYYKDVQEAFGDDAILLLAEHEGSLLGGIVVVAFGGGATYLYGASSSHHRNLMPTYLLQWEGMAWASKRGCREYDLWGIPKEGPGDESERREEDGLWGVYRFKQGFGGDHIQYAGAFDYQYKPLQYRLWQRIVPLVQRLLSIRADIER
jgi:peptidoglycan pentaglycine glycine transferase (the first glycine)